ncbi:hypothetical protein LTR08_005233 [Meristemomyces frigidus]|nr:hypothetical protein LTR08_005233 [Meristemomyces frigidus]
MADKLQKTVQDAGNTAKEGAGEGTKKWDAMSEEQKKHTFDSLPADQKKNQSYYEWIQNGYQHQYENWMPWIEDTYLKWFTKDNKTSYAAKGMLACRDDSLGVEWCVQMEGCADDWRIDTLDKSKVTGVDQVDNLQDGVNGLVGGQFGQGGLLQPVGDAVSKEAMNRTERGGKDESGSYGGAAAGYAQGAASSVTGGAKSAGGYLGGMLGGGKK